MAPKTTFVYCQHRGKRRRVQITLCDNGEQRLSQIGELLMRLYLHPQRVQGVTKADHIKHVGSFSHIIYTLACATGLVKYNDEGRLVLTDERAAHELFGESVEWRRRVAYMSLRRSHPPEVSSLILSYI